MFGWDDFKNNGKLREENRVENTEERKLRRKFSLLGPQFSSSQIGRKIVGRKVDLWHFYTNALSHLLSSQTHAVAVLESSKEKKKKKRKQRARAGERPERMRALLE